MPDPEATLGLLVEAAIAIAGFSGVVVVFGRRAAGQWSVVERTHILNLLANTSVVLFLSLVGLLLLHADIAAETTWRIGSALWSVIAGLGVIRGVRERRAWRTDPLRASATANVALWVGVSIVVVLSLVKALALGRFWPFLAAQMWCFVTAFYSFAVLIIPSIDRDGDGAA